MHKNTLYRQAEQRMFEYESLHHMRNTQERRTILLQITKNKGRFTPSDVVKWMKPYFISQATVYNTLTMLEKAHIIQCLPRKHDNRRTEYELTLGDQSCMMMICSKCGRVSPMSDKATDIALNMKNYRNFIMHHYSVYIYGECKHCVKLNLTPSL